MNKIDAIILAGAPADPQMVPEGGLVSRAMIRVGDKTMLQWVVDALRGCSSIGKILAVGDVTADGLDAVTEPGDDLVANIKRGIEQLDTQEPVLVVSSDIPLLTAKAVQDFVDRAVPLKADLAYPIIPKAHCQKRYPQLKRTYLKTADGVFTGGNLMLLRPEFVSNHWEAVAAAHAARKHVFKLARMIGVGVFLRVIASQLVPAVISVSALERAASRVLGAKVAAVVSAYPEIGEDVDKLSDLEAVRKILLYERNKQHPQQS